MIIDAPLPSHKWAFAPRFRRHAFGWRSQTAVQRIREATAEIQRVAKKDPALAATGAVLFLEKVSPALEHVDSSSGAIGTAVNHAIEACVRIIAEAPVDDCTRDQWLDRLWEAHQEDAIPYIERLGEYWGELCDAEAIALARRTPCDPRTLTRAARDFASTNPRFAAEAGLAALRWITAGYGYEITGLDVLTAYSSTLEAAKNCNADDEIQGCIHELLAAPASPARDFVVKVLGRRSTS